MADDTRLNPGVGGDLIATDDIAGVKFQRVKVVGGTDGTALEMGAGDAATRSDSVSTAEQQLLAASPTRKSAIFYNKGDTDYWLGEGTTVVTATNMTVRIPPGGFYVTDFHGEIRGRYDVAPSSGRLHITAVT